MLPVNLSQQENKGHRIQTLQWEKEVDQLHQAVQGLGTDETCIVQVLARLTNKERRKIIKFYRERFEKVRKTLIVQCM